MADPAALQVAVSAMQAVQMLGMPEGRIPLAQAVVHIATAPKSNASYKALDAAIADVRAGKGQGVPAHLRDAHYSGAKKLGHGVEYQYAHDAADKLTDMRCMPWSPSSTRPTTSSAPATTIPRATGTRRSRAAGSRRCAASWTRLRPRPARAREALHRKPGVTSPVGHGPGRGRAVESVAESAAARLDSPHANKRYTS